MNAYEGIFIKKDGSERKMRFCKVPEMPQIFLESKVKNARVSYRLSPGRELVWDLDKKNFRVFNYNALIGPITVVEFDEKELV
jgi:hypothetical protein